MKKLQNPTDNKPAAEQCGQFPEVGINQTCKQEWEAKLKTSKPRTAAAGKRYGTFRTW